MRLEELKKDIPETPDFIHQMIQEEVGRQLENRSTVVNISRGKTKKHRWSGARVAAVAAACTLAASTAAYAGSRLYHMYIQKKGTYSVETRITADSVSGGIILPEKVHDIKIQAAYIPEGMEWTDEYHLSYADTPWIGGISCSSVLLDNDDFEEVLSDTGVIESEQMTFGSRTGVYLRYQDLEQDGSFNQRIYLLCPEEYRMILLYIGDDVSKDDAVRFAENLSVTETDTMINTKDFYTWSDFVSPQEEASESSAMTSISEDELKILEVGDTLNITGTGEEESGEYLSDADISVSVDSVQVADDLSILDETYIPEEWKEAIGNDGKLKENKLSYIREGDGVESLDELVNTRFVKQKLVYVTITYQNNTDSVLNHMLYLGSIMLLKHENGIYRIYERNEQSGEEYDHITGDGIARTGEMTYYSTQEAYGNGGNYISSLNPGERVQVEMAWIVNEDDLAYMYLNLCGSGAHLQFSEDMLQSGVVDIRQ